MMPVRVPNTILPFHIPNRCRQMIHCSWDCLWVFHFEWPRWLNVTVCHSVDMEDRLEWHSIIRRPNCDDHRRIVDWMFVFVLRFNRKKFFWNFCWQHTWWWVCTKLLGFWVCSVILQLRASLVFNCSSRLSFQKNFVFGLCLATTSKSSSFMVNIYNCSILPMSIYRQLWKRHLLAFQNRFSFKLSSAGCQIHVYLQTVSKWYRTRRNRLPNVCTQLLFLDYPLRIYNENQESQTRKKFPL